MDARAWNRVPSKRLRKTAAASTSTGPTTSIHDVPDDLVKLVLLRLDSPVWLVRAASTCKRWRGIIAAGDGGAAFLRLSRVLHPPAIAGHYHLESETTEFVHSPSPVVHSSSRRRFTSLDFLDNGMASWRVVDCYGGLVLLRQSDGGSLPDLVVCDPFARVFRSIPGPPAPNPYPVSYGYADASLLGGGDDDGVITMSNFRVLYRIHKGPRAFVFSATADEWRRLDTLGEEDMDHFTTAHVAGRLAGGSLCLGLLSGEVMVLDNATLNFSKILLPSRNKDHCDFPTLRVVHSSSVGTEPQITRIVRLNVEEVEVFRQVGVNGGVWVLEHSICRLFEATRGLTGRPERRFGWLVELVADGPGFVVLSVMDCGRRWLVSVDVDTMKMAVVPERTYGAATRHYTLPWHALFQVCVD